MHWAVWEDKLVVLVGEVRVAKVAQDKEVVHATQKPGLPGF